MNEDDIFLLKIGGFSSYIVMWSWWTQGCRFWDWWLMFQSNYLNIKPWKSAPNHFITKRFQVLTYIKSVWIRPAYGYGNPQPLKPACQEAWESPLVIHHVIVNSAEVKTMSFYVASMPMCHINPWDFQRTDSTERIGSTDGTDCGPGGRCVKVAVERHESEDPSSTGL